MAQILSQWQTEVDPGGNSPGDFLEILRQEFQHQMSALKIEFVRHGSAGIGKRTYLRIHYRSHYVDIGAIPTIRGHISVRLRFCKDDRLDRYDTFVDKSFDKMNRTMKKNKWPGANFSTWLGKAIYSLSKPNEEDPHRKDDIAIFFEDVKTITTETIDALQGQTGYRR